MNDTPTPGTTDPRGRPAMIEGLCQSARILEGKAASLRNQANNLEAEAMRIRERANDLMREELQLHA